MKAYQQPDGSFSSDYFNGPRSTGDIGQRIGTTGHTLEFLAIAVPDKELNSPWLVQAVSYLCDMLEDTKEYELECGGLYHACTRPEDLPRAPLRTAPGFGTGAAAGRRPLFVACPPGTRSKFGAARQIAVCDAHPTVAPSQLLGRFYSPIVKEHVVDGTPSKACCAQQGTPHFLTKVA